ncbi:MAG: DUF721 domain-containing protein, partial [Gammaproteobacteria bacterium]|nr:DUF721 domain-containing protein [Phycisphaerae bacterium]NIQ10429.1 DUF721 domain-containing protein [Gammaproteobacteria bacterium]NIX29412.1 DUF721 domain-containing protein [Phycisphaerae bacterium]
GQKSQVADLVTTARKLRRLNRYILSVLDQPLTDHCQVARFERDLLVLSTDSPVWASRLRYYIPTLLHELKQNIPDLQGLKTIKITIAPLSHEITQNIVSERKISDAAAGNINAMAESIENPALREALLRLARHHTK